MDNVIPIGVENCVFLQTVWEKEKLQHFAGFLQRHNNQDVVPTFEALQKVVEFYHNKRLDMLKLF